MNLLGSILDLLQNYHEVLKFNAYLLCTRLTQS
ncbi:hypothetical protein Ple7327_3586 [Pleurocapsa sp. PCC 7327]|nr:hypothetical protein Ple7327_3586 [Pleurocapsa sp. PCC 7327]